MAAAEKLLAQAAVGEIYSELAVGGLRTELEAVIAAAIASASYAVAVVPVRAWEIVKQARQEGWYEDNPGWTELDRMIADMNEHK